MSFLLAKKEWELTDPEEIKRFNRYIHRDDKDYTFWLDDLYIDFNMTYAPMNMRIKVRASSTIK